MLATLRQHEHTIGGLGLVEIVRREEHRRAARATLRVEEAPEALAMLGVEAHRGLVEDEERRCVQRGARDVGEAAPAAGELARELAGTRPEPHAFQRVVDGGTRVASRHAGHAGGELEVLSDGEERVDGGLLEHEPEPTARRAPIAHDVVSEDARAAATGRQQCREQQHRRGLARAIGSEQPDECARRHDEVQRLEGADLAVVAAEARGLDRGRAHAVCGSGAIVR